MAADATTLTEKMRAALRISSTNAKITEEIEDCIRACKADLKNDGVKAIDEADGLIIRTMYHEIPPRVEYTLSETGAELATPVVRAIHTFGEQYKDAMRNPPLN